MQSAAGIENGTCLQELELVAGEFQQKEVILVVDSAVFQGRMSFHFHCESIALSNDVLDGQGTLAREVGPQHVVGRVEVNSPLAPTFFRPVSHV